MEWKEILFRFMKDYDDIDIKRDFEKNIEKHELKKEPNIDEDPNYKINFLNYNKNHRPF